MDRPRCNGTREGTGGIVQGISWFFDFTGSEEGERRDAEFIAYCQPE